MIDATCNTKVEENDEYVAVNKLTRDDEEMALALSASAITASCMGACLYPAAPTRHTQRNMMPLREAHWSHTCGEHM